jgi:WD40 repeat protein
VASAAGIVVFLAAQIPFLMIVYKMWGLVQDRHVRTTPVQAIGLLFVPLFNLYWVFVAIFGLARDANSYALRYGLKARQASTGLAITFCIMTVWAIAACFTGVYFFALAAIQYLLVRSLTSTARDIASAASTGDLPAAPAPWRYRLGLAVVCCLVAAASGLLAYLYWPQYPDLLFQDRQITGWRYGSGVLTMSFNPDGRYLLSAHGDGKVRIWDIQSARHGVEEQPAQIRSLNLRSAHCAAISRDGKRIAMGDLAPRPQSMQPAHGLLKVLDLDSDADALELPVRQGGVRAVALSADGSILAVANADSINPLGSPAEDIAVWDVSTGEKMLSLFGHGGYFVKGLAFSPDDRELASIGQRGRRCRLGNFQR